jgi:aspartate racemase
MKHIGIIACSAEGAALCYRTICADAQQLVGEHRHPEISMHTHPLTDYMVSIRSGDWAGVPNLILSSARKLASIGAQFAICPDNTIHQAFNLAITKSPIPWIHIADPIGMEAKARGYKTLGITGTKYLVAGPVYPEALRQYGIICKTPSEHDCERINDIIFKELTYGTFTKQSRLYFNTVVQKFKNEGCDGVVLGCTEIPLLVDPNNCPLPTLDSTRLLAKAAIRKSLEITD